jgi:hypothetical protein
MRQVVQSAICLSSPHHGAASQSMAPGQPRLHAIQHDRADAGKHRAAGSALATQDLASPGDTRAAPADPSRTRPDSHRGPAGLESDQLRLLHDSRSRPSPPTSCAADRSDDARARASTNTPRGDAAQPYR